MKKRVLRYFQSPAFSAAEWTARNPYLNQGEIGFLIEAGKITRAKVGPGYWTSLEFLDDDVYDFANIVTNPIGDVTTPPTGESLKSIIRKMISPYKAPAITNLLNDLGGPYNAITTREVGESFAGPVNITFLLANPENLLGSTPISINGAGWFTSASFAFTLPISLSVLVPPLSPSLVTTIVIGVTATHTNGTTVAVSTTINFFPRIMWASSTLSTITNGAIFVGKSKTITNNFKNDYNFPGGGYSWLAIPSMLNPGVATPLVWTDVTDPSLPAGYSMEAMGTIAGINNGVGTYNYEMYRSTFNLINPTVLRVR